MQRTRYRREVLEFILGSPRDGAGTAEGTLALHWPCGCTARGNDPSLLTVVPCDEHAAEFEGDESE